MLEKAEIHNLLHPGDPPIMVLFNPEEYTLSKDINYAQAAVPGLRSPLLQFVHGQLQTLEMELLVDTYEAHGPAPEDGDAAAGPSVGDAPPEGISVAAGSDARQIVERITGLMAIDEETHAPPPLEFVWGSLTFRCVLSRVTQRYVMFLPDGTPVRARLQVSFSEFTNREREAKEEKRQTADFTKLHRVAEGETLAGIATIHYENPQSWRPIAIANDLTDPRRISVGDSLRIPSLPFTDPRTGEVVQ